MKARCGTLSKTNSSGNCVDGNQGAVEESPVPVVLKVLPTLVSVESVILRVPVSKNTVELSNSADNASGCIVELESIMNAFNHCR